jgi:serine/threonine-protein kinase
VVRIFDLDEELMAIAMEHVPGGSVRDRLSRRAAPVEEARRWLVTAAEAMAFVHGRGWVHRDLKPSNWLLRSDGRVVLTDFGVAARIGQAPSARVGGGEGTLAYMPPEQRAGAPAQPAEDVHAFGATLAEIAEVVGGDNAAWVELAKACMRREPRDRPTVVELRAALGEAGDDRGPGALAAPSARS